jgi:hypothetical protein
MPLIYSPKISQALRDRFESTDRCKAMRANMTEHGDPMVWSIEHARELRGCLDVWLFGHGPGNNLPQQHIHVTVQPDKTESTVNIHFLIAGEDRLHAKDFPHGPSSPN